MPLRRTLLAVAAAGLALAVVGPVRAATTAHAAAQETSTTREQSYAATDAVFANPERGFYRYTETHLTADRTGHRRLDPAALTESRLRDGVTLVFRYIYLDAYRDRDRIDPADLDLVRADLAAARAAGVKLVVRFAYTDSSGADAPRARVLGHIAQLAPVLAAGAEVIAALQAGFIGRWGEWYYTDHFASDPGAPWRLTDADWRARRDVLLALLDALPAAIPVQVRYPSIKQRIFPDAGDARARRVGVHNDCFLASADDYGTLPTAADRGWLAEQTRSVLMGGETCGVNAPRTEWASASADLAAYHWTYLNAEYHPDVLASWGAAGRAEAGRRLGYRIRLKRTALPATVAPGARVRLSLTFTNDGYAAPVADRPFQVVLRDGDRYVVTEFDTDLRTWAPGGSVTVTGTVAAPRHAGRFPLYLVLPDPSPVLADQRPLAAGGGTLNSAYAVRLANAGTWDAVRGWNDLARSLTVG